MRYSLLAVAVSCTLMLTACNKSTETAEPAADTTSSAATTAETTTQTQATPSADTGFKSAENIAMNITGAGASEAPKSTVFDWICLIPPDEPID